jgi:hypothetical protein
VTVEYSDEDRIRFADVDRVLDELIAYQHGRVMERARRLNPRVTADDVMNPIDIPELSDDPEWNYEDGLLAGYRSAQAALRARLRDPAASDQK